MHAKSDSEVTSLAASTPPRSPRRPLYYVVSPSHADKMLTTPTSAGCSPITSPYHHHHNHSYDHHYDSREYSTSRFSASLKNTGSVQWKKIVQKENGSLSDEEGENDSEEEALDPRCYVLCFFLGFFLLFSLFSLILWASSKAYRPHLAVKNVVFEGFNVQAGMDQTGVPTKMLSINSTVKMVFRNKATFFGVHVTSTPLQLYYSQLNIASGSMKGFYQSRKSGRVVTVGLGGAFVPVYGGGSSITSKADGEAPAVLPLTLTFVVRSMAYVLGKLVKSRFYTRVRCDLVFKETMIGKPIGVKESNCRYTYK